MDKIEILKILDESFDKEDRDSAYSQVRFMEIVNNLYTDNKKILIEIFEEWLFDYNLPHMQAHSLIFIRNYHLSEFKSRITNVREKISLNDNSPVGKDLVKLIDDILKYL
ncbi:MAG TPA: hypothetical protein DHV28_02950 [Ignavibacteriales bacterium]|nr:hypothetical protein [Ignavibacteriales bacterium]